MPNDALSEFAIGRAALMPNPALKPLSFLIGTWRTSGTHPLVPGATVHGRTSCSWHEGGAFLIMHSEIDHPEFPSGVAIIGSDNGTGNFTMLWFDEREISRDYEVTVGDGKLSWRRDAPEMSQTNVIRMEGSDKLVSEGKISEGGAPWSDDLSLTYIRAPP